jgi:hypothetical protein
MHHCLVEVYHSERVAGGPLRYRTAEKIPFVSDVSVHRVLDELGSLASLASVTARNAAMACCDWCDRRPSSPPQFRCACCLMSFAETGLEWPLLFPTSELRPI